MIRRLVLVMILLAAVTPLAAQQAQQKTAAPSKAGTAKTDVVLPFQDFHFSGQVGTDGR